MEYRADLSFSFTPLHYLHLPSSSRPSLLPMRRSSVGDSSRSAPSSPPSRSRQPASTTTPLHTSEEENGGTVPHSGVGVVAPSPSVTYTGEWGIFVSTVAGVPPAPLIPIPIPTNNNNTDETQTNNNGEATEKTNEAISAESAIAEFNAKQAAKRDSDEDDDEDEDDEEPDQHRPTPFNATKFTYPTSICPSRDEKHLLVCDSHALRHLNTVKRVVGILSGVVRGAAIWRDHRGHILIADTDMNCIRRITAKGELVHVAGSNKGAAGFLDGITTQARFNGPTAICSNGGDWNTTNHTNNSPDTPTSSSSSSSSSSTSDSKPPSIPLLFFVCDTGNCAIRIVTDKGHVTTLAGAPPELMITGTAQQHHHHSHSNSSNSKGRPPSIPPAATPKLASPPTDGAAAPVVVDGPVSIATFLSPVSCAYSHTDQSLIVCDSRAHNIRRISRDGLVWTIGGDILGKRGFRDAASFRARFDTPSGVVVDREARIFIADRHNHAIRVLTPAGFVHTIAGTGQPGLKNGSGHVSMLNGPVGLTLDIHGSLYVADTGNHVIRRLQFVNVPIFPREIGDLHTILVKEWYEYKERSILRTKQQELRITKLERQLLEQKKEFLKEFSDYKRSTSEEFVKVRSEQMQIMHQLISSMQNISGIPQIDRGDAKPIRK